MKQIITLSLFALCFFAFSPAQAQEKDDILAMLEILLDLDEVQDLYQHELPTSGGPTLIILKPERRSLGRYPSAQMQNLLFDLRNDEFSFFNRPIQVMTDSEAKAQDINPRLLVHLSTQMSPTETRIGLGCYLWESRQQFSGQFLFVRDTEEDDWELTSKNSDKRSSR